ncbi:MAG: Gfo/Idh/MocA family oxidoreductase, partial [Armatimonadetes bacterium]|nr:Gfo/Idh/MocA family oxidoreductase [Armatimonadota bacterium]
VGILGLGRGRTHVSNFLALDNAMVIGVADRFEHRRDAMRERVEAQGGQLVAEYDELLALKPDAIVVATNGKLQVEHSCQAMEAGLPVLSEIPGGYTFDEMIRLRECVERTGALYMLAENTCYWDFFRYFRKWVVEGRFGEVVMAEGEYVHDIPATVVTADGQVMTPTKAREQGLATRPTWRADQPPIQYSTHDIGPLLEVMDDRIVSVSCRGTAWRNPDAPLRADGQIALFETAKGALIRILVTLNTYLPSEHRYRLFGIDGGCEWFLYERFGRRFTRDRTESQGWERLKIDLAGKSDDTSTGHGGADLKVARAFTEAVLNNQPSPIDVYRAIEYCLPGIIAAKSAELGGAPLPVPDLRRQAFSGTRFWETLPLPTEEPEPLTAEEQKAQWD